MLAQSAFRRCDGISRPNDNIDISVAAHVSPKSVLSQYRSHTCAVLNRNLKSSFVINLFLLFLLRLLFFNLCTFYYRTLRIYWVCAGKWEKINIKFRTQTSRNTTTVAKMWNLWSATNVVEFNTAFLCKTPWAKPSFGEHPKIDHIDIHIWNWLVWRFRSQWSFIQYLRSATITKQSFVMTYSNWFLWQSTKFVMFVLSTFFMFFAVIHTW